ncbi:hypothetical protein PQX77_002330 [Marasmius sp. AFHP31]|nr:hypothetical protein PQX77_002330 [Marasmius sp. AFHP31]
MDPRRLSTVLTLFGAGLLSSLHASANVSGLYIRDDNSTDAWTELSWDSIKPSTELQWTQCYTGEFQCTRLQVPLDYDNPDRDSAIIALIRLPAEVSSDSEDYLGPILFNPGGPGGSGVDTALTSGKLFRSVLGPQFDLVSFDPRGVQRSTPSASFYKTQAERVLTHHLATELNHSTETVESFWGYNKIMGSLALQRGKEYLPHINTDHSARDMLKIVEAYGEEKIQYWGFSYGSILGSTFASMFPDKVGRLIIDGVPDPEDYYGMRWLNGVKDINNTLEWFFTSCKEAGPEACAFYEDSVEAMEAKLNGIYASLIDAPIPVVTNGSYGLVDYRLVHYSILSLLYTPFASWREMAGGLAGLAEGNGTAFYELVARPMFECDCDHSVDELPLILETMNAYICNDGDVVPPDVEAARAHYQESTKFSSFGSIWASFRIACSSWVANGTPQGVFQRYTSDVSNFPDTQLRDRSGPIGATNTSSPLLVIGNVADPVTSITGARKTSGLFPGSVLLTQDSPGHCSIGAPSVCTAQAVRAYFVNGTLPAEGTVCPMDGSPFDAPANASVVNSRRATGSEDDIRKALQELARNGAPKGLPLLQI